MLKTDSKAFYFLQNAKFLKLATENCYTPAGTRMISIAKTIALAFGTVLCILEVVRLLRMLMTKKSCCSWKGNTTINRQNSVHVLRRDL